MFTLIAGQRPEVPSRCDWFVMSCSPIAGTAKVSGFVVRAPGERARELFG